MYDRHLATFIQVADSGSFLNASEKLYVSANAVTKQINLLESDLGLTLFIRSNQGLTLTASGHLIYEEAKKMIRHSNMVLRKAKELESNQESIIRVGVSLMNPASILLELWDKASAQHPNIQLQIVPFEDTEPAFLQVLNALGETIDLVVCPYQTTYWGDRYRSFHLKDIPVCVTCSRNHKLAKKPRLSLDDLYGETLIAPKRGLNKSIDMVRDELEQHPQIQFEDVELTDFAFFNRLAASEKLSLSYECWSNVHPLLMTIPVNWAYTSPYGLIYTKDPSRDVLEFIMAIGKVE